MAASSSLSLKEYLKRYQSGIDEPKKAKKKKKKEKPNPPSTIGGVLVVDNDPVWQKPVQLEDIEEEDDFAGDETPQVEEDIEVKRMMRLQALRSSKPYHAINEDGSGWVSIPKPSRPSVANGRDLSPPRNKYDDLSPPPHQSKEIDDKPAVSDKDLSPPRHKRRHLDTPSPGPGDGSDVSPPRRRHVEDLSPPRRAKSRTQDREAGRGKVDDDLSLPRKPGKGSVDDLSPPRGYKKSPEVEPHLLGRPRKGALDDLSPYRQAQSSLAADLSPPRRTTKRSPDDLSPPRRAKRSLEATDVQSSSLSDLANLPPPRRVRHGLLEGNGNADLPSTGSLPPRIKESSLTKEAKRGGLLSRKEMREETSRKRKEEKSRFAAMDPLLTGKGAEAVCRDKEGKRISKEELMKSKEKKKKEEKPLEWGKGLAQKRDAEERGKELELEKERPFARSRELAYLHAVCKNYLAKATQLPFII